MDVIVDGQAGFAFQGQPADALAAVGAISDYLRSQRRGIVVLRVDGTAIQPGEMEAALSGKSLDSLSRLEVESESLTGLVKASLSELEQSLPDLAAACHNLAEVFQSSTPEAGLEPFNQLARIWQNVKMREQQVCSALELDIAAVDLGGKTVAQHHEELNTYLEEAVDALRRQDMVALGDVLEYELAPRAEGELQIVELLRARANALPS